MKDDELLEEYETYLTSVRKVSKNTCSSYLRDIRQYGTYLHEHTSCNFSTAQEENCKDFLEYLRNSGKSVSTVSRCVASLRSFHGWMANESYREDNPAGGLVAERVEHKLPEILTMDEVKQLLSQPELVDRKGYRDKAILELMYATGVRVSELIDLDVDDVNLDAGFLTCRSRNRLRQVPMHAAAVKAMRDYIEFIRPGIINPPNSRALFVNMNGKRMSRQGLWKVVKSYQQQAGIDKDITPHTLRHSFAAHMLENGADVHFVQQMMGHSDVSTTQVYTQVVRKQMEAYHNAHPKAQNEETTKDKKTEPA